MPKRQDISSRFTLFAALHDEVGKRIDFHRIQPQVGCSFTQRQREAIVAASTELCEKARIRRLPREEITASRELLKTLESLTKDLKSLLEQVRDSGPLVQELFVMMRYANSGSEADQLLMDKILAEGEPYKRSVLWKELWEKFYSYIAEEHSAFTLERDCLHDELAELSGAKASRGRTASGFNKFVNAVIESAGTSKSRLSNNQVTEWGRLISIRECAKESVRYRPRCSFTGNWACANRVV